jgi:hypothetical protein
MPVVQFVYPSWRVAVSLEAAASSAMVEYHKDGGLVGFAWPQA